MANKTSIKSTKVAKRAAAKRVAAKAAKPRKMVPKSRRGAKPTLLSGGNPQIAKAYGNAPVRAYIAAMPGWKSDVGRRLRQSGFLLRASLRPLPPGESKQKDVRVARLLGREIDSDEPWRSVIDPPTILRQTAFLKSSFAPRREPANRLRPSRSFSVI